MKEPYRYYRDGLRFEWQGGAYIEIFEESATVPHGVINVWDYEKDVPKIERSIRGFVNHIDDVLWEEEHGESI